MGSFDDGLGGMPGRRDEDYRRGEAERLRRQDEERRQEQDRAAASERERRDRQREIDALNDVTARGGAATPSRARGGSKPGSGFGKLAMAGLAGFFVYLALQNVGPSDGSPNQQQVGDITPPSPSPSPAPAPAPISWETPLSEKPTEQTVLTKGLQLFMAQVVTVPTTERMRNIVVDQVFDGLDKTPFGHVRFGSASLAPMLQVTVMSAPINSGMDLTHAFLCAVEPGSAIKLVSMKYSDGMVRLNERVSKDGDVIDLAEIAGQTKDCAAAFSALDARAAAPRVPARTAVLEPGG
jgi:hypothetical protein